MYPGGQHEYSCKLQCFDYRPSSTQPSLITSAGAQCVQLAACHLGIHTIFSLVLI
jgi:hypothetical protein